MARVYFKWFFNLYNRLLLLLFGRQTGVLFNYLSNSVSVTRVRKTSLKRNVIRRASLRHYRHPTATVPELGVTRLGPWKLI